MDYLYLFYQLGGDWLMHVQIVWHLRHQFQRDVLSTRLPAFLLELNILVRYVQTADFFDFNSRHCCCFVGKSCYLWKLIIYENVLLNTRFMYRCL